MTISKTEAPLLDTQQLRSVMSPLIPQFEWLMRLHTLFYIVSFGVVSLELLLIVIFFPFLASSMLMGFALAILFLTLFSFLMLRLYFQAVKPEQLQGLKNQFIDTYKTLAHYQEGAPEHLLGLSHACCKLSDELAGSENRFFPNLKWLNPLKPLIANWSGWLQWQDVLLMRELLLNEAVQQHIKLVRYEPTHPESHAALANVYVLLSSLYSSPLKKFKENPPKWTTSSSLQTIQTKFQKTQKKAIEEFQILCDYAPNDPWVHLQLAYSYHDLEMPLEEIREYETILNLQPEDQETRYKLGALYFSQDMNAKGLRIYEELRRTDPKRAEALIRLYS